MNEKSALQRNRLQGTFAFCQIISLLSACLLMRQDMRTFHSMFAVQVHGGFSSPEG